MPRDREKNNSPRRRRARREKSGSYTRTSLARTSFRAGGTFSRAPLSHDFKQDHRRGHRNIQRRHFAQHRNRNQEVAFALDQIVESFAFSAQNQRAVHVVVQGVVGLFGAFVKPHGPHIVFFQFFNGTGDIRYLGDGHVLARSRRHLGDGARHARGSAFRNDDAVGSGGIGGA